MIFSGSSFGGGFLVGFGVGFVTREIVGLGVGFAKPITKSVIKVGVTSIEKSKETLAHIGESFEDILAEVNSTLKFSPAMGGASATAATSENFKNAAASVESKPPRPSSVKKGKEKES